MAKLYNLAAMTVASTGTGTITLGSAATINGVLYLSFAAAGVANGEVVAYSINDVGGSEVGTGTYTSSGTTLTRTPITSTNGNAAINMTAAAIVKISPAKADIANLREINNFSGTSNQFSGGPVLIGTSVAYSNALLDVNYNSSTPNAPQGGIGTARLSSADDGFVSFLGDTFGTGNSFFNMRAASGTMASPSALAGNHTVGDYVFNAYDGAAYQQIATIEVRNINQTSSSDKGSFFRFDTFAAGTTTGHSYYFNGSGCFGINTSADYGAGNLAANGGLSSAASTTKTTNYTMLVSDSSLIFNGAGSLTLTLLSAASYSGRWLTVKTIAAQTVVSASSNVVPITGGAAGTAILAGTAGKWANLQSDGTNWIIMASN